MNRKTNIVLAATLLAGMGSALAQNPVVHATKGQSEKRQAKDEGICQASASKKTGFDPTVLAENSTALQPGKGMTSVPSEGTAAMGGSAAGATSGGTASPETGTAPSAPATTGASSAGMTSSGGAPGATQAAPAGKISKQAKKQFAQTNSADVYNHAFSRCMTSRGYMVENVKPGSTP
jgi:hypothetical protein